MSGLTHLSHSPLLIMISRSLAALVVVCLTGACTVSDAGSVADSTARDSTARAASATPAGGPVRVDSTTIAAPPAATPASTTPPVAGTVAFDGVPPLRVGMSAKAARAALGIPAQPGSQASCSYLDTKGKSGAYVMMEKDTIVRLEVRDKSLATEAGARVGDSEQRVLDLYKGRVKVQPHKYLAGGHYLVVTTPADAALRLVLETDGKEVTAYRVGREPAVEYVEGCG